jgi:1,4-dihydroxy-2-naphthoyl-CoA hydrolase
MTRQDAGIEGPEPTKVELALEHQEEIFKDTFPGTLGVRIVEVEKGKAVGLLEVGPNVRHPGGYAHGGALAGFGDTCAAWATFPALAQGEIFTTIEVKANFISGVTDGRLRGEAVQIHKGGRTMVIEVRIYTDDDERRLVAVMLVTQAILRTKETSVDTSRY